MYKKKIKSLFNKKCFKDNVDIKNLKYSHIKNIIIFFRYFYSENNKIKKKEQTIFKYFHVFINNGDINKLIERHLDSDTNALTLKKMIAMYGLEKGTEKFNIYRDKQKYSNSFEYYKKKGFTKKEYDEYNKSRAITESNLIKKYGVKEGKRKFENYKNKQAYTNTLPYFQEKYGLELGKEKYNKINFMKSHTFETFMLRYGCEKKAIEELEKYYEKKNNSSFYSKMASELFLEIEKYYNPEKCYYMPKNKEFGKYIPSLNSYCFYDFCDPDLKLIIEFNGDYWHCNPNIYKGSKKLNYNENVSLDCMKIWERDYQKILFAENLNYTVITVWEYDFKYNREDTIDKIKSVIDEKKSNKPI